MPRPIVPAPTIPIVAITAGGIGENSSRNDGVFRHLLPIRYPLGNLQTPRVRILLHLVGERPAHFVIIALFQPEFPVTLVLSRPRPAEDRHYPRPPPVESLLNLALRARTQCEPLHPVIAVSDVRLLLLEDT